MDANAAYIYSGYAFDAFERKQGKPRLKPPFPADVGLFGWPTTVAVATTPRRSAAAARRGLRALGATATRARICSASVGTSTTRALWRRRWATAARTRREALRRRARRVGQPAHIPGGCSVPVLPIKKCEDSLKDAQSGLGTGAVIVMDKSTDIIAAIARFSSVGVPFFIISLPQFYKHELCGQCTLCREGTTWIMNMMNRMVEGRGHRRKIDMLLELTKQVEGCMISLAVRPVDKNVAQERKVGTLAAPTAPGANSRLRDVCGWERPLFKRGTLWRSVGQSFKSLTL
ncbi:hypothetical protein B0H11DRAFT_1942871 [Mycena galericulata]|nr:hypothetical protein B0H11DRAFT_1942871 [Mycena galericulata]